MKCETCQRDPENDWAKTTRAGIAKKEEALRDFFGKLFLRLPDEMQTEQMAQGLVKAVYTMNSGDVAVLEKVFSKIDLEDWAQRNPMPCPLDCGGHIELKKSIPKGPYKHIDNHVGAYEVAIPTCNKCGGSFYGREEAVALDASFEAALKK